MNLLSRLTFWRKRDSKRDSLTWAQGPNQGPPDLDEVWRDFNRKLSKLFGGSGKPGSNQPAGGGNSGGSNPLQAPDMKQVGGGIGLIVVVAVLLWLASGFFIVPAGQQAAILQFGEFRRMTDADGFQWRAPYPIQSHEIVNLQQLRQVEIGYRGNVKTKNLKEALMLTFDENIIDIQFAVQYRVQDAKLFLFENRGSSEELVLQAAETAIREVVGRSAIDKVLYESKEGISQQTQTLIQNILDGYKSGITISNVTLQNAQPPEQVQAAFDNAVKAGQDRERFKNEAQAYANDVIPKAEGTAARLREEAQGYKQKVVAAAVGEAERFKSVLTEYEKAPRVTRDRMYLETMQQVMGNTSKIMMDVKQGSPLLYVPLDKLIQGGGAERAVSGQAGVEPAPLTPIEPVAAPTAGVRSRETRSREAR